MTMMSAESLELVPVGEAELPIMRRIFEFYLYDFSEILGSHVGGHGGVGPSAELVKAVAAVKK